MVESRSKALRPKSVKQDDSIMGTNNSSIVSKRSVERLYYPNEPHFFRYFVKKPQRRAPLINRGYWLRMQAIDSAVHQFLMEESSLKKLVINLGCGYDPLPWQSMSRYLECCKDVLFIDVDYKELMLRKREVVMSTTELNQCLTDLKLVNDSEILLQSQQYLQIGCDLRDVSKLAAALAKAVDLQNCLVLFTAEVSVTYMDIKAADALIKWAGGFPQARFALLEQLLPEGIDHPFAKTMMAHFEKLQTPLGSVKEYPTTLHQAERFRKAGWGDVSARNLWDLWNSDEIISSTQRLALDHIEPFDEWEEFAVFGCHYIFLVARNGPEAIVAMLSRTGTRDKPHSVTGHLNYSAYPKSNGYRRFAAPLAIRGSDPAKDLVGHLAGYGLNTRLNSCDLYTSRLQTSSPFHSQWSHDGPGSRMCHTVTELGDSLSLLVGGRASPDNALSDCWLYHKLVNVWERVDDLPSPRYRHSATLIGCNAVLVIGGKSGSKTLTSDCLVWTRRRGWVYCDSTLLNKAGEKDTDHGTVSSVFGAILAVSSEMNYNSSGISGVLAGGISKDCTVQRIVYAWSIDSHEGGKPLLRFRLHENKALLELARFGAATTTKSGQTFIVGGIGPDSLFPLQSEIIRFVSRENQDRSYNIKVNLIDFENSGPRPLLIGCSVSVVDDNLLIMGGGAVCFSFGTFWNPGCYTLQLDEHQNDQEQILAPGHDETHRSEAWVYSTTQERLRQVVVAAKADIGLTPTKLTPSVLVSVTRRSLATAADFDFVLSVAQPVVLEGLSLGSCTESWTTTYLRNHIGSTRKIVVHHATEKHMDFKEKNFEYVSQSFGDFLDAIQAGEKLYLRSLAVDKPSGLPADLSRDFPTIATDFKLPGQLALVLENAHSSPLRISGPVDMWLHYDVMSNVLCQVQGSKHLLLFPPSDAKYFDFAPGASSSSVDVFKALDEGNLLHAHPHELVLRPGDILYIPSLWLHTASPIDGISVSVNVFFRDLQHGYAAGKDVYGNRDLQAYEKGRQDIAKITKSFEGLPAETRNFYLQRLAGEFSQKAGLE